jgi:ketosteroid isomerase-like protein
MLPLVLSISACSTTHFAALSDDTHAALTDCKRPDTLPDTWLLCAEDDEACRRARELPVLVENAKRHHRCASVLEQVKREADRVRDGAL